MCWNTIQIVNQDISNIWTLKFKEKRKISDLAPEVSTLDHRRGPGERFIWHIFFNYIAPDCDNSSEYDLNNFQNVLQSLYYL